jgi:hypothetical protein
MTTNPDAWFEFTGIWVETLGATVGGWSALDDEVWTHPIGPRARREPKQDDTDVVGEPFGDMEDDA